MRRLGGWTLVVGAIGALLVGGFTCPDQTKNGSEAMDGWRPTLAEVRQALKRARPDARHSTFNELLTGRYRAQQLAVRVIARPSGPIELRCGANMDRRMMAHVAIQTARDAAAVFGRGFDLDLYETYVAVPKKKVAELRQASPTSRATLRFDDKRWAEPPRGRPGVPSDAPARRAR